jgi:PAS domain S-box-containing protein
VSTSTAEQNRRLHSANSVQQHHSSGGSVDRGQHSDNDERYNVDKKEAKRAANRRSAQLSRKRKKHHIEELKDENESLRRKEQILRSIPDLIVMFNSAGILGFVSHSVSNFLDYEPQDLEGTSFWHRLCEESVRLLKAAFMDALAARRPDMDTAPLGEGLWEVRLKDKDGSQRLVTLNGVVHFSGKDPECVCSLRPKADHERPSSSLLPCSYGASVTFRTRETDSSADSMIVPQQSVVVGNVTDDSTVDTKRSKMTTSRHHHARRTGQQGSDGETISESGSDRL